MTADRCLKHGDTFEVAVTYYNPDSRGRPNTGSPIDLSDYTATLTICRADNGRLVHTADLDIVDVPDANNDPVPARLVCSVPPVVMEQLTPALYAWQVEIYKPDDKRTLVTSTLLIEPRISEQVSC